MTRIRRLIGDVALPMRHLRRLERQIERKRRTVTAARAFRAQTAAHFTRGQGAAMQSETMTVFLGGESMVEDLRHVFRLDADSIVADRDPDSVGAIRDAHDHLLVLPARRFAGIFGVAQKIYQNLQDFVFLDDDFRYVLEFALQAPAMPGKASAIHAQGGVGAT